MNETMQTNVDWNDLAAFLAVARNGGLTPAAKEIGSSAPTLGRKMRSLERALNRELFVRRTHGYDLTAEGQKLREELEPVEALISQTLTANSPNQMPVIRIAAGTWTMLALVNSLPKLIGSPPDVRLRLLQGESNLSIPRRETTIGFRSSRPREDGLAGRKLRLVRFAPYATPGAPNLWIVIKIDTPSARWVQERSGEAIAVETDTPRLALDLVLAGLGRVVLPTFIGDAEDRLERVGDEIDELAHDQWLVMSDQDRHLPEVRRVLNRITDEL